MLKRCGCCKVFKELESFSFRNKITKTLTSYCKKCQAKYSSGHYKANKQTHNKRRSGNVEVRRSSIKHAVNDYKYNNPCVDCGEFYLPKVMDFDHVRGRKINDISTMINLGYSLDKLLKEIAKCDLVCANCHRGRTWYSGRV